MEAGIEMTVKPTHKFVDLFVYCGVTQLTALNSKAQTGASVWRLVSGLRHGVLTAKVWCLFTRSLDVYVRFKGDPLAVLCQGQRSEMLILLIVKTGMLSLTQGRNVCYIQ